MTSFVGKTKYTYTRLRLLSRPVVVLPLIIFIVFVIVSLVAFGVSQSSLDASRDRVIERRAQTNALIFFSSLSSYKLIASGGAGLAETTAMSSDAWGSFVSAYDIATNFPSINAVTYAQVMSHDDAQSYVDARNAATNSSSFSLSPTKPAGDPYIMTMYAYPNVPAFASRLGIDEYAVASRQDAIKQAMITGKPVLTNLPQSILPSDSTDAKPVTGFIIFAPVYNDSMPLSTAAERQAALIGTSNVSFQAQKFFDTIYSDTDKQSETYLTIYQGSNQSAPKIYAGGVHPAKGQEINYVQHIPYAGQTFTFAYQFSDGDLLTSVERTRPVSMLVAGIALGGLLAVIMLFSIRARFHKISLDKEHEIQVAKDELLSLASHQLRTPATGVKQYMGMVLQGFAGEITQQQKEFLQKAYESNDRQLHIINDILHLAKLDAGRIVLSKTTFNMGELVMSVVDEQMNSAQDAEVALQHKVPKKLEVYADSHMMRMVVENLISNAIKYTNPGGTINVSLKSSKGNYELHVKDTGVGIADSDIDKLFRQFSRVANERSHLVSGTGVGLYLVKNLVELHGGEIKVTSKPSFGTTFIVVFPREERPL